MAYAEPVERLQPDLDERIRQAERDLIARDERVVRQVRTLGRRVRQLGEPRRWAAPLAGGAVALVGAWWLWRAIGPGRRHAPAVDRFDRPRRREEPGAARREAGGLVASALKMLPLLWPLLPVAWRAGISPASAGTLSGLAVGLAQRFLRKHGLPPPRTAAHVDIQRYAGTWHEIARLPLAQEDACRDQPVTTYTPRGRGLDVLNRCRDAHGRERIARGTARIVEGSGGARLKLSFAPSWLHRLPLAWSDYWVLYRDADYSVALVGTPDREHLWVLARDPRLDRAALRAVLDVARVQGFPVERVRPSR